MQATYHRDVALDLFLGRSAVASDGALDRGGRILGDRDVTLRREQEDRAAGLAQFECARRIAPVECCLDREDRWIEFFEELDDRARDDGDPIEQAVLDVCLDDPALDVVERRGDAVGSWIEQGVSYGAGADRKSVV